MQVPHLAYVALLSSLVVVIVGVWRYKLLRSEMKILFIFFGFVFIINALSAYFALQGTNNLWLFHIYTLLEYSALMLVFSYWQKTEKSTLTLRLAIAAFFVAWLIAKSFLENLQQSDSFSSSLASVLLIGVSSYMLFVLFQQNSFSLVRDFRFWVLSAVLIDHASRVILFALDNIVLHLPIADVIKLWSFHWLITIIANFLYSGSFLCRQYR